MHYIQPSVDPQLKVIDFLFIKFMVIFFVFIIIIVTTISLNSLQIPFMMFISVWIRKRIFSLFQVTQW